MSHGPPSTPLPEPSITLTEGWHCQHLYYRFDRAALAAISADAKRAAAAELEAILDPKGAESPMRLQTTAVSGNRADFGLMIMDSDPLKIDSVRHRLNASKLGAALVPAYSFVSLTEISEYVPSVEQYGERLIAEGETKGSPTYEAKLKAYGGRLPAMNRQRLTPEFPEWPATCFYPMNKKRATNENWFRLPFVERNRQMAEHAQSGMTFAGKASQLITVAVGLDDWEWGVTLWGRNPKYLTEIVYRMRFDQASAQYGEFGEFFSGYIMTPAKMLAHCRVTG